MAELSIHANIILNHIPDAWIVVLIRIFDSNCTENGRMVVRTAHQDAAGNLDESPTVEFGRTGPGGTARARNGSRLSFVAPAYLSMQPTTVDLGG